MDEAVEGIVEELRQARIDFYSSAAQEGEIPIPVGLFYRITSLRLGERAKDYSVTFQNIRYHARE